MDQQITLAFSGLASNDSIQIIAKHKTTLATDLESLLTVIHSALICSSRNRDEPRRSGRGARPAPLNVHLFAYRSRVAAKLLPMSSRA